MKETNTKNKERHKEISVYIECIFDWAAKIKTYEMQIVSYKFMISYR